MHTKEGNTGANTYNVCVLSDTCITHAQGEREIQWHESEKYRSKYTQVTGQQCE